MAKQTNVVVKVAKSKKKGNPKGKKGSGPKEKSVSKYKGQGR